MERLERLKNKFAGKNFLVFTQTVTSSTKEGVKTYEDMQVLACDSAIDIKRAVYDITGNGGRIIYSDLPGATKDPRIGEVAKLLRSFQPINNTPAPEDVKASATVEEIQKKIKKNG